MKVGNFVGLQAKSGDRRSCGSAFFLGVLNGVGYVCSNAHVWGTSIGSQVFVSGVDDMGVVVEKRARLKWAGFRSGSSIDWAIAELTEADYMALPGADRSKRLVDFVASQAIGYVGGPRCELPSFRRVRFVRATPTIVYGGPAAIGGMSGGAWQHDGAPCAITTWTDGTHNMAQPAQALRATMRPEFFGVPDPIDPVDPECPCERAARLKSETGFLASDWLLPLGAVVACDSPQDCSDGWHGEVSDLSPLGVLHNACHGGESIDQTAAGPIDWLELLRLLVPLLLEFLRNRPK